MEELDYDNPSNSPDGTYIVVSDDPDYNRSWLDSVPLRESRYCPGCNSDHCSIGGYSERLEKLRVALRVLQQARGQDGLFVVNPMHVLLETDRPKHLLIVGPAFDQTNLEERVLGESV
jgi:hypothetical protein